MKTSNLTVFEFSEDEFKRLLGIAGDIDHVFWSVFHKKIEIRVKKP